MAPLARNTSIPLGLIGALLLGASAAWAAGPITFSLTKSVSWSVSQPTWLSGVGIVFLDHDGDGHADVLIGGGDDEDFILFPNLQDFKWGKSYASDTGLTSYGSDVRGLGAADYDNDGDTDIFVANWAEDEASTLLRNDDGVFVDVTEQSMIAVPGKASGGAWGDYDNDGLLDLYVSTYQPQLNYLYRNNGDGSFTDVTFVTTLGDALDSTEAHSFQAMWFDVDRDRDVDIYVANDRCYSGWPSNLFFENQGGGDFTDSTVAMGLAVCMEGMGLSTNDINADGFLDMYMTNIHFGHVLMRGTCQGYKDISLSADVPAFQRGWGVLMEDFDHDGHPDIFVAHEEMITDDNTNRLFHNLGDGTFEDISEAAYVDAEGESFMLATADIDRDGDMDIVVGDVGTEYEFRFLRNDTETDHWLQVQLEGVVSNRDGIGAQVEVFADGRWRRRARYESSVYGSRSEPILHFGLGDATVAKRVVVRWPSGIDQLVEDVAADQRILLVEPPSAEAGADIPAMYGELCGDGVDNDCDGETDEGFDIGAPCTVTEGACLMGGVLACAEDQWTSTCVDLVALGKELCGDGLDNDCDGETDEDFDLGAPCTAGAGVCTVAGITTCAADGLSTDCTADAPTTPGDELCADGLDNDCDGETDELDPLFEGTPCVAGTGACAAEGVLTCAAGTTSWFCDAPVGAPIDERCGDGVDNDCDGETDEGFEPGGACVAGIGGCAQPGALGCVDGEMTCDATPLPPSSETCGDGVDDDCDGETDEGFPVGEPCVIGTGVCAGPGLWVCNGTGTGVNCDGEAAATAEEERCGDELDNDCDGETDEGFPIGAPCVVGQGDCAVPGNLICAADGYATSCWVPGYVPPVERCDAGIDNDCDGETDEGFDLGAACAVGVGACAREGVRVCTEDGMGSTCDGIPGDPTTETPGDDVDNDCDGEVDEADDDGRGEGCRAGADGPRPLHGLLPLLALWARARWTRRDRCPVEIRSAMLL